MVDLRFKYGEFELKYDKESLNPVIRRKCDSWLLIRIHRNLSVEDEIYQELIPDEYGLNRSSSNFPVNFLRLRANMNPKDFLLNHLPRLTEDGFEIFGEQRLKSIIVNRGHPTISIKVSTGIDWFDFRAEVQFGKI